MSFALAITPHGQLTVCETGNESFVLGGNSSDRAMERRLNRVRKAFASGQPEGIISLAAEKWDGPLPPSLGYWRDFAGKYLLALCHTPENVGHPEIIPPPSEEELAKLVLDIPPMPGAEYVSGEMLADLWGKLDFWVRREVAALDGLAPFLKQYAPLWHQVGRVCFHLAENRRNPEFPFAFLATYTTGVTGASNVRHKPLSQALQEYAGAKNKPGLVKLLSPIYRASVKSEFANQLIELGDVYQPLAWSPREAYRFLQDIPTFEEAGIVVRMPDWWKKRPRPRIGVTIGEKKSKRFGAAGMLDFQVEIALGDETLTQSEWQELMEAEDGLVFLRGQWVEVNRERLREALEHWKQVEKLGGDGVSFIQGMRLLAGAPMDLGEGTEVEQESQEWSFVHAGKWLDQLLSELRDPEKLGGFEPGKGLQATLRHYQVAGTRWLWLLANLGLGACLADDMGLGKTIQVLALLLALKKQKKGTANPSLLVLPASLLANWQSEIERFAPTLRTKFVHASQVSKEGMARMAKNPKQAMRGVDVVLTTYGMLLRQKWRLDLHWRLVVLDEAQAIKTPGTRQTKAVKALQSDARIAMTGTPVENRLSDLWSLFDFLCPGLLGSQSRFKQFVKSLQSAAGNRYAPLRGLVQPYILRRLKTDKRVISDLPSKTEVKAFCGLAKRQAAIYGGLVKDLANALETLDGIQRRGLVLAYLMRFKQLCNHPSQLLGDAAFNPKDSGKFARLAEIGEEIASRCEKVLVFTQFREMTMPLAEHLTTIFGRPGLILHGGTAVKKRKKLIDEFQQEGGPPFFVLSLKAGGTGLNLTEASHVIHFDRWWNPAVENQATDRAFRIGQQRNVLVHKFICQGTIEEKIDALIDEKSQLASDLLEGGAEQKLTEMSNEELIRMVSLDIERAKV